ncbi:MAG: ribosome hibernation-promoting factor, HPF/YfiA family [Chlamydiota bacterium]
MVNQTKAPEQDYNIIITGRHIDVTDSMKDYAKEKISKVERFSHHIIDIVVTMDIQKLEHRIDVVLKVDHIKIKVQASTNDMYASIDQVADKLQNVLRRYKDRIKEHQARSLTAVDMSVNVIKSTEEDEVEIINEKIEEQNKKELEEVYHHEVVKTEKRPLKMLTLKEAVMKMDLSQDTFMIYRSEEDQKLKVIYRRQDEDYGVIAPE